MAVAKKIAERASENAAAKSLLLFSEVNIISFLQVCAVLLRLQAMKTEGLAGTIAAAMQTAETAKAKTAARARLLAYSKFDIWVSP